jgi:c-di-GMP-binding flagellar brake protein YcgR
MDERRRAPRIKEENEVIITVVSAEKNLPKEKIIKNQTKDISVTGARLQTQILLPVDTLLELDFRSKSIHQQINALGKVKWVKVIIEDESYEAGVEFFSNPSDAIRKLGEYISWKRRNNVP